MRLMDAGVGSLIVNTMDTNAGDQRVSHVGLSSLRNLSIPSKNKEQAVACGVLAMAVKHLSTENQLIQFESVGILKSLLMDQSKLKNDILFRYSSFVSL